MLPVEKPNWLIGFVINCAVMIFRLIIDTNVVNKVIKLTNVARMQEGAIETKY